MSEAVNKITVDYNFTSNNTVFFKILYIMGELKLGYYNHNDYELLAISAEIIGVNGILKYDTLKLVTLKSETNKNIIISIPFSYDIKKILAR